MTDMPDERPPRLSWGMWKRFLLAAVTIIVLSAAATATAGLEKLTTFAQEALPASAHIATPKGLITPAYDGEPQTFLLIGSDRRAASKDAFDRTDPPHSDTLLLVRLDPNLGQTSVLSIPRDLLVKIHDPQNGKTYYPQKVNAAYTFGSYDKGSDPAAALAAETVKSLLGIPLNGIVDVTFKGFINVVDQLGCVYVNVDHRYYNVNLGTAATDYSSINLQPGYQKLCYDDALSYVRYRHTDSDFVRVARQQDFIRDIREQANISLGNIDSVLKSVGHAIRTNFTSSPGELEILAKLLVFSQQKPLRQVHFRYSNAAAVIGGGDYVTATPQDIAATVHDFLYGNQKVQLAHVATPAPATSSRHHAKHGSHTVTPASIGLYPTTSSETSAAVNAGTSLPFRMLYPNLETGPAVQEVVHPYALRDQNGHLHHAYSAVFQQNGLGGYYDVEGMDWQNPPIIANPSRTVNINGRRYILVDDGSHIHLIAWREHGALYWVNNTLLEDLTNAQMISIANSVQPLR
jgi:LCP family protein required for cell wall assembly